MKYKSVWVIELLIVFLVMLFCLIVIFVFWIVDDVDLYVGVDGLDIFFRSFNGNGDVDIGILCEV